MEGTSLCSPKFEMIVFNMLQYIKATFKLLFEICIAGAGRQECRPSLTKTHKVGGISTIKTSKLVLYCLRFALPLQRISAYFTKEGGNMKIKIVTNG